MCESGLGCICMPYKDSLLIAAQVTSIVAIFISWGLWWSFLFFSLPAFILIQLSWCLPLSKGGLITAGVLGTIAGIFNVVTGSILIVWYNDCDNDYWSGACSTNGIDYHSFIALAVVSLIGAILWLASSVMVLVFACGRRYVKALAQCKGEDEGAHSAGVVASAEPVAAVPAGKAGSTVTKTITEMPDGTTKTVETTINADGSKTVKETISKTGDNNV